MAPLRGAIQEWDLAGGRLVGVRQGLVHIDTSFKTIRANLKRMRLPCAFLLPVILFSLTASAQETPAEISRKSRERGALNLVGLTAELKLVTTGFDGAVKDQTLTSSSKNLNGKSHVLARFSAPAAVAGVAILTIQGAPGEGEDVSLYLPKLKRVRKVAKSDRSKSFMDTDFSYADIVSSGLRDENLKQLQDSTLEGRPTFVLEGVGDEESIYGRVTLWIDKETYVPMKVEYQDKAGLPAKRFRTLKLKKFKDRVLASESLMENLKTKSKTQLIILKLEEVLLSDEAFSERGLERG
jgi:Outer membrane lipoprotein-sorting protein